MSQRQGGFTFVELLVSVTIIAVLMGAAIVSYSGTNQKSRDAKRQADMQTIRAALEICRANTGTYPANVTTRVQCSDGTITLSSTPVDPRTSAVYTYTRPTTTTYTLSCTLELTGTCAYTQP